VTDTIERFSRALADLIARRWRDFEKAFGDHVSRCENANRLGSGMDAQGRLEIAHGTYRETVREAMEEALLFSNTEGVEVAALLSVAKAPLAAFGDRINGVARFPTHSRRSVTADIPDLMSLDRMGKEFSTLLDNALTDAQAGRAGFMRRCATPTT
jgi:hypothetical protein